MKKVGVAILGLGVVGSGAYRILTEHRDFYRTTQNVDLTVECVLERDASRVEALGVPKEKVASNIAEIVANPDVSIVVEVLGGVGDAREYVLAALHAGKTVVTSNKELYCKYSHELERAAKRQDAGLYFEASCVGGVPVIRTLLDGLQANEIGSIMGIINGTTNYILTRMTAEGISYEEALEEAQRLGFAEADPTADVDGYDAVYKLSILSSLAFHTKVPHTSIYREGIRGVSAEDIRLGKELGYVPKLLAIGKRTEEGIEVRVHPTLVKKSHPLASVEGSFNAVFVTGDSVGEIMLYGRGAGSLPTGSAIVSDVIYAATHSENKYSTFPNNADADKNVVFVSDFKSAFYLRLVVTDKTGVLGKIAATLGKYNVSIDGLIQTERENGFATVILTTYETNEVALRKAVEKLGTLGIGEVKSVLRVVS